jgi:hypothetical protein
MLEYIVSDGLDSQVSVAGYRKWNFVSMLLPETAMQT